MDMDFVLAPDDNYAQHAAVVVASILAHNSQHNVRIWILDGGLSESSKEILEKSAECVEFLKVDTQTFKSFPSNGYISVSTWYRFSISKLLPESVGRALYLDCDVAVAADVSELFETDLSNAALAAVKDCIWRKFDKRANLPRGYHYFNAGVLLLNLDYWRQHDVSERLFDFANASAENMKMMDQSILNIVLQREYKELPLKWNVQYMPPFLEESCYGFSEFAQAVSVPKIIHYVNKFKPWSERYGWLNPLNGFYLRHMDSPTKFTVSKSAVFFSLFCKNFMRKPLFMFRRDYWKNALFFLMRLFGAG